MMLGVLLTKWRWAQRINLRDAAKMINISTPTLSRIENGKPMDGLTLSRILVWLMQEAK